MTADPDARLPGSFRDPAGFVFQRDGTVFRQINRSYEATLATLMDSGLYANLVDDGLLIPHETAELTLAAAPDAAAIIRPAQLKFVSYPYEWSFSQLKAAALATLRVQRRALDHGLSLKDASARNIQLHEGRPTLIDTLSFERYEPGFPWVGYRQFCQHFLAPLAVMAATDVRLGTLLQSHLDGVPARPRVTAVALALAPPARFADASAPPQPRSSARRRIDLEACRPGRPHEPATT